MENLLPKCENINLETISRQDRITSKEFAYLIGVYLTDASISECNFNLQVIDKDFIERVLEYWKIFIPKTKAYLRMRSDKNSWNKQDRYVIKLGIGEYATFLKTITSNKHHRPLQIIKAEPHIQRWFIAGIMDGDGWISKTKRNNSPQFQYRIGIGGVENGWIYEFRELLTKLDVTCLKIERILTKNNTLFCRFNIKPISFFNANLFFTLERKVKRCSIASTTAR